MAMRLQRDLTTAPLSPAGRPEEASRSHDGVSPSSMLCPVMVGRDRELGILTDALSETVAGRGRTLFVLGEAGVGKTRLASQLTTEAARRNLTVLRGRAVESDRTVAFRPLAEALQACLRRRKVPDVPELEPYLPGLAWILPDLRGRAVVPADEPLVVVCEGVLRLLRALGRPRGSLLVLEDMHWADPETLAVVEYLSDQLDGERVLCLVTLRREEQSDARTLAHALAARRATELLDLQRLSDPDVEAMARSCLDVQALPPGLDDYLVDRVEGLPFLVEELLAASAACGALVRPNGVWEFHESDDIPVPQSFADSLRRRLAVIDGAAFEVLSAAAILGRCFHWELLPAMTALPNDVVLSVLRGAKDAQLVELSPADAEGQVTYRFRHALTRDVMVRHLLPSERVTLARRALAVIESAHPGLPDDWCHLAARLSDDAGEKTRAASLQLEAGRRAFLAGDLASAERLLEAARRRAEGEVTLQIEIDRLLTEVLALMGKTNRVREVGGRLLSELARVPGPPQDLAVLHLNLARAASTATNWLVARDHLQRARLLAATSPGTELVPRVDALAAQVAIGEARLDEAERLALAALSLTELEGLEKPGMAAAACEALEVLGRRARLRNLQEAQAAFSRSVAIAETHGLPLWRLRALHELGTIDLFESWRVDRLLQARRLARREGALSTGAFIDLNLAAVHLSRNDLEEALEFAEESAGAARCFGLGLLLPMALIIQAAVHALAMRRGDMEDAIEAASELSNGDPNVARGAWGQCRAELSFVLDERERALEELDTAMHYVRERDTDPWPFRGTWALLRTVLDDGGDAAREELRASVGAVPRVNRAYLAYADAVAAGRAGRTAEAEATFALAEYEITSLEGAVWWRHRARRLVAEAALEDGWGEPVPWLQEATIVFAEHGHDRLANSCQSLLRRAGANVPRPGRGDAQVPPELRSRGVTAREMDVLRLVCERLSSPEIAKRLFISPRTVEKHVERLMAKTGASRRTDLAALLRRH